MSEEAHLTEDGLSGLAVALRTAFDRSFAEPARSDTTLMEHLLAIRVGDDGFAIRLSEISGLHAGKKVTRVPGSDPALFGIAGFRGAIRPIYRLATLLGVQARTPPRWLAIAAATPVALAFDAFEHHLRVASDTIRPLDASTKDQPYVRDFVRIQDFIRPILHLPSILDAIRTRGPAAASTEERLGCLRIGPSGEG